jgi:hypothetical protein
MSIKVNDLRIGNLLRVIESKEVITIEFINNLIEDGNFSIGYKTGNGDKVFKRISELEPIDFKNDLDKYGFTDHLLLSELKEDNNNILIEINEHGFMLYKCDNGYRYINLTHERFKTFLHLLQNQYYFVTGKELDVSNIK